MKQHGIFLGKNDLVKNGCLRPAGTFSLLLFFPNRPVLDLTVPLGVQSLWERGSLGWSSPSPPPCSLPSSDGLLLKQQGEQSRGQAPPQGPHVSLVSVIHLNMFLVELVSDELEFLSNADLYAACWLLGLLIEPLHPPSLSQRPLVSNTLKLRWEVQSKACVAVEEWSGLLGHPAGQHIIGQWQDRAGCLGSPVLVLYLPEGCAPAVGVWFKHIILLIVHTAAICQDLPQDKILSV